MTSNHTARVATPNDPKLSDGPSMKPSETGEPAARSLQRAVRRIAADLTARGETQTCLIMCGDWATHPDIYVTLSVGGPYRHDLPVRVVDGKKVLRVDSAITEPVWVDVPSVEEGAVNGG